MTVTVFHLGYVAPGKIKAGCYRRTNVCDYRTSSQMCHSDTFKTYKKVSFVFFVFVET